MLHMISYSPCTPVDMDWTKYYDGCFAPEKSKVEFVDIGCGYGGLLGELRTIPNLKCTS